MCTNFNNFYIIDVCFFMELIVKGSSMDSVKGWYKFKGGFKWHKKMYYLLVKHGL
jgi:hypothetical protein